MGTHLAALALLLGVLVAWVAVQQAWRRAFPAVSSDPDALVARGGCHPIHPDSICETSGLEPGAREEELS